MFEHPYLRYLDLGRSRTPYPPQYFGTDDGDDDLLEDHIASYCPSDGLREVFAYRYSAKVGVLES